MSGEAGGVTATDEEYAAFKRAEMARIADLHPGVSELLAAERRAGRLQALGECMCEKCEPEWTAAILDAEVL